MVKVTIHVAKTNLSKLIAQVEAGGEVVICRGDKAVARLEAVGQPKGVHEGQASFTAMSAWDGKSPRKPGSMKGVIGSIPDDAFAPLTDEEIAAIEDAPVFPAKKP